MSRPRRLPLLVIVALASIVALATVGPTASASTPRPRWVRHAQHYSGGLSNGVRERLAVWQGKTTTAKLATRTASVAAFPSLENVQLNGDTDPPLPQDEPGIALNLDDPMNAVAAANDYTGDGFWIGYTTDGGQTWTSQWKDPKFSFDGGRCFASDPTVAYSVRDAAFYLGTLCYFSTTPASEIHVWKSTDGGATWSDSTKAAVVVTNHSSSGDIDPTVFYDKELMTVDNEPGSAHFGRIYVTYTKFHMTGGSYAHSDYCPIQAAYTDSIPTANPSDSVWSHTAVVPDDPGGSGRGASANQFSTPLVDETGGLNVAFVSEDCNTSYDRALLFARSTDGGATFGEVVRVDQPGDWIDNANRNDNLPGKGHVRFPGTLGFTYDATRDRLIMLDLNAIADSSSISAQYSDDFGATWSDSIWVSVAASGGPARGDQFFPAVGVDSSGDYFAIWQDTRNDQGDHRIETFQGTSIDGGLTWTNELISTASFDPRQSFFTCGCFIGDYNQIAVSDEVIYPTWTDGRNSAGRPVGDTDIFGNVEIRS
jgi:BNR/Asp-box repeat